MERRTFEYILFQIGERTTGKDNGPNAPVDPAVKLLVTLYWLAQLPTSYNQCGEKFGLAGCTALKIILEVCAAISEVLGFWIPSDFGNPQQVERIMAGFAALSRSRVPCVAGVIDCTHFRLESPDGGKRKADYYDRESNFSIVMQAIVDSGCKFLNIRTGYCGSVHDSRILKESSIFEAASSGAALTAPSRTILGQVIRPFLLGDAGYPLLSWLLTPYPGSARVMGEERWNYNYCHSSARMCVERSFGLLKARFRILRGTATVKDPARFSAMITAAVILQNISLDANDRAADDDIPHCP